MIKRRRALQHELERLSEYHPLDMETKDTIRGLSAELFKLLGLFDEVLLQEYTRNHANIPHLSLNSPAEHHTCDFCGADIFHSFFSCDSCITPGDGDQQQLGLDDGLLICAGCYVEGRTCKCGDMQVAQCGQFTDLLHDRNLTAKIIHQAYMMNAGDADSEEILEMSVEIPSFDSMI